MDFVDVAMVFIKFCMCSLILVWFSKVYLGIHDVHKKYCEYLDVNPKYIYHIYISYLLTMYIYIYSVSKTICIYNYENETIDK